MWQDRQPYACSMCPTHFSEKGKVAPHERTHTGEKPYGCFYCGKTFPGSSTARKHERTWHGGMASPHTRGIQVQLSGVPITTATCKQ